MGWLLLLWRLLMLSRWGMEVVGRRSWIPRRSPTMMSIERDDLQSGRRNHDRSR